MSSSRPLLSSAEEAEEYDLLPAPTGSSSSRSTRPTRRRHSAESDAGSSVLPAWLPSLHSRRGVILFFGATFVVGLLAGHGSSYAPKLLKAKPSSPVSASPNPYTLPGVVLNRPILPPEVDVNEPWGWYDKVRWSSVPTLSRLRSGEGRLLDKRDPDGSEPEDIQFANDYPSLLEELKIAHENGQVPEGWHDWGVNKTILGVGDSLMRNNLMFFSKHISSGAIQREFVPFKDELGKEWKEGHQTGVVNVPVVDLKVCNWFHQGMIEEPVDGFYNTDSLPHNFEQKLENIFLASVNDPKGLNGRTPDLVIFESLSWDLLLLAIIARDAGDTRYEGRPFDDIELGWYRGRVVEVLSLLRRTFPTSKIILQTPHIGAKSQEHVFSPIRKFQQAQAIASVALETGVEVFDWGRIVSSLSNELVDGLHFRTGAATWIWGEMILYYLRLAHLHPTSPPSPAQGGSRKADRITQQDMIESYKTTPKIVYPLPMTGERRRAEREKEERLDEALRMVMG